MTRTELMVQANISRLDAKRYEVVVKYHDTWNRGELRTSDAKAEGYTEALILLDDGTFQSAFSNADGKYVIGNARKISGELYRAACEFSHSRKIYPNDKIRPSYYNEHYYQGKFEGGVLDNICAEDLIDVMIHLAKAADESDVKLVVTGDASAMDEIRKLNGFRFC